MDAIVTSGSSLEPVNQVSELELLQKMEDEHFRLQRQVRSIQVDRENRCMGVHPQFRRQDLLLKTLKREYISLKKDLKIARSGAHKKRDLRMKKDLKRALLLRNKTQQECDNGVTLMDQLEGLFKRNKEYMLTLKKTVNTTMGELEERRLQSEHRLVSTENKLEAATLRFNTAQCENKKIREEIEHMLRDRALFNQSWSKMINTLGKGKKFLTDLFESSTLAYDQRDEWVSKLKSVQEKGKMDQILQLQEMRDLQKTFDHEMKLHHFLASKGVVRINTKQEEREDQQKTEQEEKLKHEFDKHIGIIKQIQEYTEEESINKIIQQFEQGEQENFSIYQLLTEVCAENIVLAKDLNTVRRILADNNDKSTEDRNDFNLMKEAERQDRLQQLTYQLKLQQMKTGAIRSAVEEKQQLLNSTMEQVTEIFKSLNCSLEPFQSLLGDKGPSLWLLDLTMTSITDKIHEALEVVYYGEHKKLGGTKTLGSSRLKKYTVRADPAQFWTAPPINLIVPADPCPACVESRWLSRVSDAEERPFTKEMTLTAIAELNADLSFVRSDRIHPLTECRVPRSRLLMATRFMQQS